MRGSGQKERAGRSNFRAALYILLGANTLYFAIAETPSKALDAAAWLVLLVLFDVETRFVERLSSKRRRSVLRAARLLAAAGVVAAMLGYVLDGNVLDAINSVLWVAVVLLLELEVRFPAVVAGARGAFVSVAALLYGGLAVLVLAWAFEGLWFDAYDAALWLTAFAMIELNIAAEVPRPRSLDVDTK
ncbi:MAG: hypothetical protein ACXW2A_02260 [Burkholderiales bacterium]